MDQNFQKSSASQRWSWMLVLLTMFVCQAWAGDKQSAQQPSLLLDASQFAGNPAHATLLAELADLQAWAGWFSEAVFSATSALELDPCNEVAWYAAATGTAMLRDSTTYAQLGTCPGIASHDIAVLEALRVNDATKTIKLANEIIETATPSPWLRYVRALAFIEHRAVQSGLEELKLLVATYPKFGAPVLQLGMLYSSFGLEQALEPLYLALLEDQPGNYKIRLRLGLCYTTTGQWGFARREFQRILEQKPGFRAALLALYQMEMVQGQYRRAYQAARELVQLDPDNAVGYGRLGHVLSLMGRFDESYQAYQQALDLDPEPVTYKLQKALIDCVLNRYGEAQTTLNEILAQNPDLETAHITLAVIAQQVGDFPSAFDHLAKYEDLQGQNPTSALLGAGIALSAGDYDKAFAMVADVTMQPLQKEMILLAIEHAQQTQTSFPELNLAYLFVNNEWYDAARTIYEKLLEDNPRNAWLYADLADLWVARARLTRARSVLHEGLEKIPKALFLRVRLGDISYAQEEYADARLSYRAALSQASHEPRLWRRLAQTYETENDYLAAIEVYSDSLAAGATDATILNNIAWHLVTAKEIPDVTRAYPLALQALEKAPDDPTILDTVGWVYFHLGEYEHAEQLLERALVDEPDEPTILYHLGRVHEALDNSSQAMSYYRRALLPNKPFDERKSTQQRYQQIKQLLNDHTDEYELDAE